MTTIKLKDSNGQTVKGWSFHTYKATVVGDGKPRKTRGWQLNSADGVQRCREGNWEQFVPFARMVIQNYGYTSDYRLNLTEICTHYRLPEFQPVAISATATQRAMAFLQTINHNKPKGQTV